MPISRGLAQRNDDQRELLGHTRTRGPDEPLPELVVRAFDEFAAVDMQFIPILNYPISWRIRLSTGPPEFCAARAFRGSQI